MSFINVYLEARPTIFNGNLFPDIDAQDYSHNPHLLRTEELFKVLDKMPPPSIGENLDQPCSEVIAECKYSQP